MELIKVTATGKYVTIQMPVELIKHAAQNSEAFTGYRIINQTEFARQVALQIESHYHDSETGLTKFQMFLDKVFEEVLNGDALCIVDANGQ